MLILKIALEGGNGELLASRVCVQHGLGKISLYCVPMPTYTVRVVVCYRLSSCENISMNTLITATDRDTFDRELYLEGNYKQKTIHTHVYTTYKLQRAAVDMYETHHRTRTTHGSIEEAHAGSKQTQDK